MWSYKQNYKVFKPIKWNRFCNTSEYVEGLTYMVMEL